MTATIRLAALTAAAFGAAGCGGDQTSLVKGRVLFDGERVTFGTVAFIGAGGRVDTAMIREDGTYEIVKAPQGDVVITVQTYPLPPQVQRPDTPAIPSPKAAAAPTGARYTPIPSHYGDEKLSPLKYTVTPGPQEYDIQLARPPKKPAR